TLAIAERLIEALARWGVAASELAAWRARCVRLARGPREGEAAFHAALNVAIAADDDAARRLAVAGIAECQLDRGAVREVRHVVREELARGASSTRLRVLLAWACVCLEDLDGARAALAGAKPWSGPLPLALAELRERRPEWTQSLAGRVRTSAMQ